MKSNVTNRVGLRWVERQLNEDPEKVLGSTWTIGNGGVILTIPARHRCGALGLGRGDCKMQRLEDSRYCFYHDKMLMGLIEPEESDWYPVLPLPKRGYTLVSDEGTARAAA